jgi:O-succinylhomoserine sulfhydrylase
VTKRHRPWGYHDPKHSKSTRQLHPETLAVRGGLARTGFGETGEALFLTSGFSYDSAEQAEASFVEKEEHFLYSRFANPTVAMFEQRLALIEGAEAAHATASGMAAMFASIASLVSAGDRVVASPAMFSSCYVVLHDVLPKWGVQVEILETNSEAAWKKALTGSVKAVFIETPSNPSMEIVDIELVSSLAHKVGAVVIVDNVMASPILQQPLKFGADVVMYSATKHMDGHGRVLGGVVLGSSEYIDQVLKPFTRHTGPSLSPFNAWVLLKSLETLAMRVERMNASAQTIAEYLETLEGIEKVNYPFLISHPSYQLARKQMSGGGSTISIELAGGKERAFEVMNRLEVFDISNNLGDSKSLITHPSSSTHRALSLDTQIGMGITQGTLRLSIGLEHPADLMEDLKLALQG